MKKKIEIILEYPDELEQYTPSNAALEKAVESDLRDPFAIIREIKVTDIR